MSYFDHEKNILRGGVFITQIDDMYKVSLVPSAALSGVPNHTKRTPDNAKTAESLCRARQKIIELAYCNEWSYFFTATFDKEKVESREEKSGCISKLVKWLQNKSRSLNLKYLLVPELHKDGIGLHAHGLLYFEKPPDTEPFDEITDRPIPDRLRGKGYLNWIDYEQKFGFCSLGKIKDRKAISFYMSKYITKDMRNAIKDFNAHVYYASKGLKAGEAVGGFHNSNANIDLMQSMPWQFKDEERGTASMTIHSAEELQMLLKANSLQLVHAPTVKG